MVKRLLERVLGKFLEKALGKTHVKLQVWILYHLILLPLLKLLVELATEWPHLEAQRVWILVKNAFLFLAWLELGTFVALLLVSLILDIDLRFYYSLWLRRIKPFLAEHDWIEMSYWETVVKESFDAGRPRFVQAGDLMRKSFWKGWAFSIVTPLGKHNPLSVHVGPPTPNTPKHWTLEISLLDATCGIYSNAGKRFLKERFLDRNADEASLRATQFDQIMNVDQHPGANWVWALNGPVLPIRWASGGVLPLVQYRGDYWVLLFFRDLMPMGLNVPNGASEDAQEYHDLWKLMFREFSEEVVILRGNPVPDFAFVQRNLQAQFQSGRLLNYPFAETHAKLRKSADKITIESDPDNSPTLVHMLHTFFSVKVEEAAGRTVVEDVVFSVNPSELGVEVIGLGWFDLKDNDCILDGELDIANNVLVRRPPVLIRLSHLEKVYKRSGSLGERILTGESADGKLMEPVEPDDCVVFDADINLRRTRSKERHVREKEARMIRNWLDNYEAAVAGATTNGLTGGTLADQQLRTLCPVTWKTLELAFAHDLFAALPRNNAHPTKHP